MKKILIIAGPNGAGKTTADGVKPPVRPLADPDFIGADAAIKRASANAVARDIKAGLVPVVRDEKRD